MLYAADSKSVALGHCGLESHPAYQISIRHSQYAIIAIDMPNNRTWSDGKLKQAVMESRSMNQVVKRLGLHGGGGGAPTTIRKHIERLGLSTAHFLGQHWSRGTVGCHGGRPLSSLLVNNGPHINTHALKGRLIKAGLKERKCDKCGITEWMGSPTPIELHHVNERRRDNRIENLQILCPNCHAQIMVHRSHRELPSERRKRQGKRCATCGAMIEKKSRTCVRCRPQNSAPKKTKVAWPQFDVLVMAKTQRQVSRLARELGVSDVAVHKRIKKLSRIASKW